MRLNKLSKELDMTSAEIVKVLRKERDVLVENSPNVKVSEEDVVWLKEKTAPKEGNLSVESIEKELFNDLEVPKVKEDKNEAVEHIKNEDIPIPDGKVEAEIPELSGPKVVGKIDLPPPLVKTKPEKTTDDNEQKEAKTNHRKKTAKPRTNKKKQKREKVIETAEELREKEIAAILKRRETEKKSLKETRKKAYLEKTKTAVQNKTKPKPKKKKQRKKKIEEPQIVQQVHVQAQESKKKPKNAIAKLWNWIYHAD